MPWTANVCLTVPTTWRRLRARGVHILALEAVFGASLNDAPTPPKIPRKSHPASARRKKYLGTANDPYYMSRVVRHDFGPKAREGCIFRRRALQTSPSQAIIANVTLSSADFENTHPSQAKRPPSGPGQLTGGPGPLAVQLDSGRLLVTK